MGLVVLGRIDFTITLNNLTIRIKIIFLLTVEIRISDPSIAVTEFLCRTAPELSEEDQTSMQPAPGILLNNGRLFKIILRLKMA